MARPFLGSRAVLGPGNYARALDNPIQRMISLYHFEKQFDKILHGWDGTAVSVWCNSATDNLNHAAGFDQHFRISSSSPTGTPVCSIGVDGMALVTGTADTNDQIILPISDAAIPLIGQNSATTGYGLNADCGYDIWMNWVVAWPTRVAGNPIVLSNQIVCCGTMTDPASSLANTDDQDFALFRVGTHAGSIAPRIFFDVVKDGAAVVTFDTGVDITVGQTYVLSFCLRSLDQKFDLYVNGKYVGRTTVAYRTVDDSTLGVPLKPVLYHEVAVASSSVPSGIIVKGVVIDVDRET